MVLRPRDLDQTRKDDLVPEAELAAHQRAERHARTASWPPRSELEAGTIPAVLACLRNRR